MFLSSSANHDYDNHDHHSTCPTVTLTTFNDNDFTWRDDNDVTRPHADAYDTTTLTAINDATTWRLCEGGKPFTQECST